MTANEAFGLTAHNIYHHAKGNPEIILKLTQYLSDENQWRPLNELYKTYKELYDYQESFESVNTETLIDLMRRDGFYFGQHDRTRWYKDGQILGVYLHNAYAVKPVRNDLFKLFFAFIFSETNLPKEFLAFHLNETFSNDRNKYKLFLREVEHSHKVYIEAGRNLWSDWIRENLEQIAFDNLDNLEFRSALRSPAHFKVVIEKFSKPEHKYFDQHGYWIRTGRGHQILACAVIDHIETMGYFRDEIVVSYQTKATLIKKWFQVEVGLTTAKKSTLRFVQKLPTLLHADKIS